MKHSLMKDSGIEWIGMIPVTWSRKKLVNAFNVIGSGTTPDSSDIFLNIDGIKWIQSGDINGGFIDYCKNNLSKDSIDKYSALKLYTAPFIVVAMYGASVGNISISNIDACVNQACCVFSEPNINEKYGFYCIKSCQDYLLYLAVGGGQPNISQAILKGTSIPLPSFEEQRNIANFLDSKTSEIKSLIDNLNKQIESLKEYKKSLIYKCVTKGLDDSVPLKDSGVEWIGEIPENWKVVQVKHKFYISKSKAYEKDPIVLSLARDGVKNRDISTNEGQLAESYYEYNPVKPGDLLLNTMDLISGANCSISEVSGVISPAYANLRAFDNSVCSKFYDYYFKTQYWSMAFFSHGKGVSFDNRWTLNTDTLMNYKMPLPPRDEQAQIANFIDMECICIDNLIKSNQDTIEKLNEYQKSLIYEYVTGKKEVITEGLH